VVGTHADLSRQTLRVALESLPEIRLGSRYPVLTDVEHRITGDNQRIGIAGRSSATRRV